MYVNLALILKKKNWNFAHSFMLVKSNILTTDLKYVDIDYCLFEEDNINEKVAFFFGNSRKINKEIEFMLL